MRTATTIEASAGQDAVEFAVEAERLGLDVCWVAEAWGADAPFAARLPRRPHRADAARLGRDPGRHPLPGHDRAGPPMTLAHLSEGRSCWVSGYRGPR